MLINKCIVRTLARFLVESNTWYCGQVIVDDSNIDALYKGTHENTLATMVEISCLNSELQLREDNHY